MQKITNYKKAASIAWHKGKGIFCKKDGTIIKGSILNVESDVDEPSGIGCIDIVTPSDEEQRTFSCVYANEFAWAEFDD